MKFLISDDEREIDLVTDANIRLLQDGLDLPIVSRELTYAESADSDGRRRIRSKNQNAEGRVGVTISGTSDSHFWGNVDNLLEIVESCHQNKGSIVYQPPGGTLINYDVESITVSGLPQPGIELRRRRQEAEITFEVRPYGRLTEVTLSSGGTIDGPIGSLTVENVPGQVDAFGALALTDIATQSRQFVEVGVQHDYDSASPEPLLLTAGTMAGAGGTLTGLSATAGTASRPAGAYTVSGANSFTLEAVASPSTAVAIATTSARPHKGLWKVRARVQANAQGVVARLAWRVGTGPFTREAWRSISNSSQWYDLDLGTIDIAELPGTHNWEGRIEVMSQTGFPKVNLDTISFIPCDTYTRLRGASTPDTNTFAPTASDDFSTLSGTIASGTIGYSQSGTVTWATSGGTGDFTVDTANQRLIRNHGSDANENSGRFARVGNLTATGVSVQAKILPAAATTRYVGLFARLSGSDYLLARLVRTSSLVGAYNQLQLLKRVSSTNTTLGTYGSGLSDIIFAGSPVTVQLQVDTAGNAVVLLDGRAVISVNDSALATGGGLASGGFGIYHANTSTASTTEYFDDFLASSLTTATLVNPVVHSSRKVDLSHEAALSDSSDGTVKNPTPIIEGNYLTLPPATRNSDKSRIVVRARRNDVDAGFADTGLTDQVTATVKATPRVTLK